MALSCLGDAFGLRGGKGVRPRGGGVGRQLVQPEADGLDMRILLIHQCLDNVRPIHWRSLLRHCGHPGASSRVKSHENVCRTLSLICRVRAERLPRLGWERSPDCTAQLGRHFIYAHVGTLGIIRLFIDIS